MKRMLEVTGKLVFGSSPADLEVGIKSVDQRQTW